MNTRAWRPRRMFAVITLVTLCTGAAAGTNLPEGYPAPACGDPPDIPERPEKFETEAAIAAYNAKVDAYNASMERLVECVREYVTNATADVERIRMQSREAIDRLNR